MRNKLSSYLEGLSVGLLGLFLLAFPLLFATLTTDIFSLPKQFALGAVVLVSLILFGLKSVIEKIVKFRRTPFDLPVLLFIVAVFISSVLADNKAESIVAFASLFFSGAFHSLIPNPPTPKKPQFLLLGPFI